MKKTLLSTLLFASLLLTACGESDKTTENKAVLGVSETPSDIMMQKNQPYTIHKGETITPISDAPKISMTTDMETGQTVAKLLSGEAKIVLPE